MDLPIRPLDASDGMVILLGVNSPIWRGEHIPLYTMVAGGHLPLEALDNPQIGVSGTCILQDRLDTRARALRG